MTTPTDYYPRVHELAELLVLRWGKRAAQYALQQSLTAKRRGDQRTMQAWGWIGNTAADIWRVKRIKRRRALPRHRERLNGVRTALAGLFRIALLALAIGSYVAVLGIFVVGLAEGWWN